MRVITSVIFATVLVAIAAPAVAQDKVATGAKLYGDNKCSVCHSINGVGNKKFPLDGVGKRLSAEAAMLWMVDPKAAADKAGKKMTMPMKSYKTLSAADLDAIVAYMLSLK